MSQEANISILLSLTHTEPSFQGIGDKRKKGAARQRDFPNRNSGDVGSPFPSDGARKNEGGKSAKLRRGLEQGFLPACFFFGIGHKLLVPGNQGDIREEEKEEERSSETQAFVFISAASCLVLAISTALEFCTRSRHKNIFKKKAI